MFIVGGGAGGGGRGVISPNCQHDAYAHLAFLREPRGLEGSDDRPGSQAGNLMARDTPPTLKRLSLLSNESACLPYLAVTRVYPP